VRYSRNLVAAKPILYRVRTRRSVIASGPVMLSRVSFDTPGGTRGTRQPPAPIGRWLNSLMSGWLRRQGGRMMGLNALVLTTVGRNSGAQRRNPVAWFPGPDDSWLIVASAAGAARNPGWYYNIAAHPDQVQIEIGARKIAVTAQQLHGAERDEAWQQISTAAPRFAQYQQKTDRILPVIRLVSREE
jgi:deazaflavin-dependent oxidoreductase (nitroreductase family)